jgi:hypothetical protein
MGAIFWNDERAGNWCDMPARYEKHIVILGGLGWVGT